MVRADAAFAIGKTHAVCQDYAVAGKGETGIVSAWLADGCSSSPHTDIGARLLTHRMRRHSAAVAAGDQAEVSELLRKNTRAAIRQAKSVGLPNTCVDATLLGLIAKEEGESICAVLCGDGALVSGHTDGTRTVHHVKYAANYPFYPAYLADADRAESWHSVQENRCTCTKTILNSDGSERETSVTNPVETVTVLHIPSRDLLWAAVFSDGAESVQRPGERPSALASVPYSEVLHELTAFKNFTGEFVQRRLQRWEKENIRRGWQHNDDVAVAALYFGKEG